VGGGLKDVASPVARERKIFNITAEPEFFNVLDRLRAKTIPIPTRAAFVRDLVRKAAMASEES